MKHIFWVIGVIVLFIFQLAIGQSFPYAPNLVLLYLCVMMQYFSVRQTIPAMFVSGILLDYFSGVPDGVQTASLIAALGMGYWITQATLPERLVFLILPVQAFSSTLLFSVFYYLIMQVLYLVGWGAWTEWSHILGFVLFFHVILNMVFLYLVFWAYQFQAFAQNRLLKKHESI